MALISCRECCKQMSDMATACPNCGCPNKPEVFTIEATSKEWKYWQLVSGIIFLAGFVASMNGNLFGSFVAVIGFFGWIIAKALSWCYHG